MFSGIVETIGRVIAIYSKDCCKHFTIHINDCWHDLKIGDSVAVNGVCITITAYEKNTLSFTAVPETLKLSNLEHLQIGALVNLERSLAVNARLSGHFVQGHVDGIAIIENIHHEGAAWNVTFNLDPTLSQYLIHKGFITIDGMSLTLMAVSETRFAVTLIPHTRSVTIAKDYQVGNSVNIEIDMLAKIFTRTATTLLANHKTTELLKNSTRI